MTKPDRSISSSAGSYRELAELLSDGYVVTDADGEIRETNASARDLLGGEDGSLEERVQPEGRAAFRRLLRQLSNGAGKVTCELDVETPEGTRPVGVTAARSESEGGAAVRWLLRDLTEQREAAETGEQLAVLVRQLPAAVVVVDADGRVNRINAAAQELMRAAGLDPSLPDAALALGYEQPDGSPFAAADRPLVRALELGEETAGRRAELRLEDGGFRALELSAAPLHGPDGSTVGAVKMLVDVSERERRELADREFVANAAHQLRNPLAAIRASIEVLQAGAKDDPDMRERFLGHIERESERLTRLAQSLLVLARAEASLEEPRKEIVDVSTLLHGIAARLDPPAGVNVEVRSAVGDAVFANPGLLEEALDCLVDNALRHGGTGRVILSGRSDDGSLLLEVLDEGPGIPDEIRERAVDPFYRGGPGLGFGLGLAIAAQAARASGGKLELEAPSGGGALARITLTRARMLTP